MPGIKKVYRPLFAKDARILRILLSVIAMITGVSYALGPAVWHQSKILYFVNFIPVPFWVWGLIFFLAGGLTLFKGTLRIVGFLLHLIILSFFDIAMWVAFITHHSTSWPIGLCYIIGLIYVVIIQLKNAVYDKVDPDRRF